MLQENHNYSSDGRTIMKANIEIIIGNNAIGKSYIIHQMAGQL